MNEDIGLSKRYGKKLAVDDLSLTVQGEQDGRLLTCLPETASLLSRQTMVDCRSALPAAQSAGSPAPRRTAARSPAPGDAVFDPGVTRRLPLTAAVRRPMAA
jgi:hypothetical protein